MDQDSRDSLEWNQIYASAVSPVAYDLEHRLRPHLSTFELDGVRLKQLSHCS